MKQTSSQNKDTRTIDFTNDFEKDFNDIVKNFDLKTLSNFGTNQTIKPGEFFEKLSVFEKNVFTITSSGTCIIKNGLDA